MRVELMKPVFFLLTFLFFAFLFLAPALNIWVLPLFGAFVLCALILQVVFHVQRMLHFG